MKEKITTEYLQCVLTPEEKANRAEIAARADGEIKRIAEEKAVMVSGFGTQTKEQQRVHDKASECVRTGVETRNVQVRVTYDLVDGIVRYRRLDTEEVYERRKITEEERRAIKAEEDALSLPFDTDDDDTEHQGPPTSVSLTGKDGVTMTLSMAPGRYAHEVEKEIASTEYHDDPFTPNEAEAFDDSDPFAEDAPEAEWVSLEDSRPAEDKKVETALYDAENEEYEQLENGFVSPESNEAWTHSGTAGSLGTREWEISHYRAIQPKGEPDGAIINGEQY